MALRSGIAMRGKLSRKPVGKAAPRFQQLIFYQ
jgi:hypothetical protein